MTGRDPVRDADQVQLLAAEEIARDAWDADQQEDDEGDRIPWDEASAGARRVYLLPALATAGRLRGLGLLVDRIPTPSQRAAEKFIRTAGRLGGDWPADLSGIRASSRTDGHLLAITADTITVQDAGRRWTARNLDIRPGDGVTVQPTDDGGYVAIHTRGGHVTEHPLREDTGP